MAIISIFKYVVNQPFSHGNRNAIIHLDPTYCLFLAFINIPSILQSNNQKAFTDSSSVFPLQQSMPSVNHASDPQDAEFLLEHPTAQSIHALKDQTKADFGDFLVVSPYAFQPHLLDLRRLEYSQNLLARALTLLKPVRTDYATAPYQESFNWTSVIDHLRFLNEEAGHIWSWQHFYIVVFRSQVPPTTNRVELGELDEKAHAEAMQSGGLLKYWFGKPDEDGRNLATCM